MKVVKVGKLFLFLIIVQTLLLYILNFWSVKGDYGPKTQFFATLLYVSLAFVNFFAFDGILNENIIQVIACIGLTGVVAFYGIFQYAVVSEMPLGLKIAQLLVCVFFFFAYLLVGWKLYLEYGWRIYKRIGADPHMRAMYRVYQFVLTFLKLDAAMALLLVIAAGFFLVDVNDYELYVNIIALIVTGAWAFVGYVSIRDENVTYSKIFWTFSVVEPIYIVAKIVDLYTDAKQYEDVPRGLLVFTGIGAIVLRGVLMVVYKRAVSNFDKGLKEQLSGDLGDAGATAGSGRRMTVV